MNRDQMSYRDHVEKKLDIEDQKDAIRKSKRRCNIYGTRLTYAINR